MLVIPLYNKTMICCFACSNRSVHKNMQFPRTASTASRCTASWLKNSVPGNHSCRCLETVATPPAEVRAARACSGRD